MAGILTSLRVIEAAAFVAAPLAGLTLAQMGADVIRVDPLGGGLDHERWPLAPSGRSLYWSGLNKCKRSVELNLRTREGRELLAALVTAPGEAAGIFITNLGPGAVPTYEELKSRRADVIMIQIVGNPDGTAAVDYTINCAVGFPTITGPAQSQDPVNHVLPAWDLLCGTSAAMAVLAAERHRRITGEGQLVRLSLADTALAAAGNLGYLAEAQAARQTRARYGNALYGSFGRDFATRDDRRVMIVAITARQWISIVEAMDLGEAVSTLQTQREMDLRREADRWAARDTLFEWIAAWVRQRDLAEVRRVLDFHGVLWGPYQSFEELLAEDPRCSLRNPLFAEIEEPGIGRYIAPGAPVVFGASERVRARAARVLGEDTEEVLTEILGFEAARLERLRAAGILAARRAC